MASTGVRYLVSNSLTHPENTAGTFKISYNAPFDLTGKKIALVSATLTKTESNIHDETMVVTFPVPKKVIGKSSKTNVSALDISVSRPNYYDRFNRAFFQGTRRMVQVLGRLKKIDYAIGPSMLVLVIQNLSDMSVRIDFGPDWELVTPDPEHHTRLALFPGKKITYKYRIKNNMPEWSLPTTAEEIERFKDRLAVWIQYHETDLVYTPSLYIKPGPKKFDNVEQLLKSITTDEFRRFVGHFALKKDKVVLKLNKKKGKTCEIEFGGLEKYLGFDYHTISSKQETNDEIVAQRPPDLNRGVHYFFIYCSLVKNVPVNEQNVPLLATLDAKKGERGEQFQHNVQTPLFVECVDGTQQLVEVTIGDDSGGIKNLLQGRTTLTLLVTE